jgi:hypothetical protein
MLKEIEEQPGAVRDTLGGRLTAEGCCTSTSSR